MSETVPVTEFAHILYRYDGRRPTSDHTLRAVERWCIKKLQRTAREADCGLAYTPPIVETERDSSARRTGYIVWTKYALLPGQPGQVLVIRPAPLNVPMPHRT